MTKHGRSFSILRIPYALKLLMQELQTMNIQMRIITDKNIDQLTSMSFSDNVVKLLGKDVTSRELNEMVRKKEQELSIPDVVAATPDKPLFKMEEVQTPSIVKPTQDGQVDSPAFPVTPEYGTVSPQYGPVSSDVGKASPDYGPVSSEISPELKSPSKDIATTQAETTQTQANVALAQAQLSLSQNYAEYVNAKSSQIMQAVDSAQDQALQSASAPAPDAAAPAPDAAAPATDAAAPATDAAAPATDAAAAPTEKKNILFDIKDKGEEESSDSSEKKAVTINMKSFT